MQTFVEVVALAVFLVVVLYFLLVVLGGTWSEDEARVEREQAELDRRGQAALEALRELGRQYPRR